MQHTGLYTLLIPGTVTTDPTGDVSQAGDQLVVLVFGQHTSGNTACALT